MTEPHYVYEFYAADGTCLYVGCTYQLGSRIQNHTTMPYWSKIARFEVTTYPDKITGRQAEKERIQSLDPIYNKVYTERAPDIRAAQIKKALERHARGFLCNERSHCKHCAERRRIQDSEIRTHIPADT